MSSAPLEGIKVIALEQAVSAPYASRQLADLGAEVIKIERPEGDFARYYDTYVSGTSSFFVWVNRSKSSLVLDLKDAADRERIETLLAEADVFIVNLAPAAAQRLGLSAGQVGERYPRIVACEITGYGAGGPRSDDKAYDLAIQAEAGAMSVTGDADASKVGFSAADIAAGSFAFSGILAALVRRGRTGEGAVVSVSMLDALAEWISAPLLAAHYGPGQPPRSGRRHAAIAPYGTFDLSDDTIIMIESSPPSRTTSSSIAALRRTNGLRQRRPGSPTWTFSNAPSTQSLLLWTQKKYDDASMKRRSPSLTSIPWPRCGSTNSFAPEIVSSAWKALMVPLRF